MTRGLRLLAQDAEDLEIISAALQDAVAKVGDMNYDARGRTLTIVFNRYRWEVNGGRVRSALQIGGVQAVKVRNLKRGVKEAVVELLSLTFEAGEPPGGAVNLMFAGGGDLRCEVECIDAVLADVSRPWPTPRRPEHQT